MKLFLRSLAALALIAVGATAGVAAEGITLTGKGATFPYPLYAKWFRDYQAVDPGVSFSYEAAGSGAGIKAILKQEVDFGASDKFLSDAELRDAPGKLLQIPTVMGAVAVVYNVPGLHGSLKLTPEVLAGIYLGTITSWNDKRIASINADKSLPHRKIVVLHRSDGSGTTNIFTDYLSQVSPEWARSVGDGTSVQWPVGTGGKGSAAVVKLLKDTPYSIGYVEVAYALEDELSTALLKNRSGKFVKPSVLATRAAAVQALEKMQKDYRVSLVNQPGADAYPIVGLTWLLVYQQQKDPQRGKKLVEFLSWELHKAEKMTSTLHYTPLPKGLAEMVEKTIQSISY